MKKSINLEKKKAIWGFIFTIPAIIFLTSLVFILL
ncbi:hypothetical protein X924_01965 [Petrotoga sp. 9PWA.NaAc.5.4]|nr:hypothetical protein X924_01965 [Petrotoga sp. 9PWA.NaAc.5.4]